MMAALSQAGDTSLEGEVSPFCSRLGKGTAEILEGGQIRPV